MADPHPNSARDRLESWKEIANYLGRSIRTAQQWERTEDLPIHRLQHAKSGSVFAYRSELDKWRVERTALACAEPAEAAIPEPESEVLIETGVTVPQPGYPGRKVWMTLALGLTAVLGILGLITVWLRTAPKQEAVYSQITDLTDSAVAPALSPDGRMAAFLRSDRDFTSPDQIYLKLLPDGAMVQLTHEPRRKCCLAFSPDSSEIAYTVVEYEPKGWNTYTISVLGGQPSLLLSNASGLTWLDAERFLFSEQDGRGAHMGIVSARHNRSDYRKIYFPEHERAMAHFSYASPDRQWALVAEMDPIWHPCRLIPLDGSSDGRVVGPNGSCKSAAWSPDGRWMYFAAEVDRQHHLWRQRFPRGEPEQITSGPNAEEGLAMSQDGRSLVTSVGMEQDAIWVRDGKGERPLHFEGYLEGMHVAGMSSVRFAADGKSVYYLMRRHSPQSPSELWRTELDTGGSEAVVRDVSVREYDLSNDGKEVVFSTQPAGKAPQLWLAPVDRSVAPKLITAQGGAWPVFGPDGQVLFQWSDGKANYLVRIGKDGLGQSKVAPYPVGNVQTISPDRRWITLLTDHDEARVGALPTAGGAPRRICRDMICPTIWAPDGKFFYIGVQRSSFDSGGKTVALPVAAGETLPRLPEAGIRGVEEAMSLPGARIIDGWDISPGPNPSILAYVKKTVHRNLYRIPIPD